MKIPTSVVSDLRPVGVFSEYSVSSTTKTDHHDIAEIFLKVAAKTAKCQMDPINNTNLEI
jgi:hypothetical protein